jgi:hypothetical protein
MEQVNPASLFNNRPLVIATMHGKESVIAPLLEQNLGVRAFVPKTLNTDQWGTFSGEVERTLDPLAAARVKCLAACEQTGATLAVASEGSFGPHPTLGFVPADEEILLFVDLENSLEIWSREISTATNFGAKSCSSLTEALRFAENADFPEHGLIIRGQAGDTQDIVKGIHQKEELIQLIQQRLDASGQVYLETDMRAMHNPSRMVVIKTAAEKLIEKIRSACPDCATPGFAVVDAEPGLPCAWCGAPTRSTLSWRYCCSHCGHEERRRFPQGKETEDPGFCDYCNP